jgi:hypothetical protein
MKNLLRIPSTPAEINVDWLNTALSQHLKGSSVVDCTSKYSSVPAQTASMVDINLTYDNSDCSLPHRMIAKLATLDPEMKAVATALDFYRRETAFYQQFPDIGISVPACYFSDFDSESQGVVILMGHLAPSESPGWGITLEQVEYACEQLTAFHAKWWNKTALKSSDCLIQSDNASFWKPLVDGARASVDKAKTVFGGQAEASIKCAIALSDNFEKIMAYIGHRPFTIVHGDYHGKQIFFPTPAGGRFAVIDWQYPFVGQGAWDITRMLTICLPTETRITHQGRILTNYLKALHAHGVGSYSSEDLRIDRQIGALVSQTIQMLVVGTADYAPIEEECNKFGIDWKDLYFLRGERVLRELDVPEFLATIVK